MISVEEALQLVLQHKMELQTEEVPLLQSIGRVLAQEVRADRDFPPFDRVTMDGIAIQSEAFAFGTRSFLIEQVQAAGEPQTILQKASHCIEVMTGAMLPKNTNAVVRYEDCTLLENDAKVEITQVQPGQNIHRQGSDIKAGEILLTVGVRITPAIVGTLASVGLGNVPVFQLPKVAICSTGDELVEVEQTPLPHQIRRSNAYMLAAALLQENIQATLVHLPDEPVEMRQKIGSLLVEHDVLLLSGAVSKGKFDYLPQVPEDLGLTTIFHKVAQKPGKPILFGIMPGKKVVFGLPGNPVSTFVCYQLFFRRWLNASLRLIAKKITAQLGQQITFKPPLAYHVPVKLIIEQGVLKASPITSTGSGDLTSILEADGLLSLPAEKEVFYAVESFPLVLLS